MDGPITERDIETIESLFARIDKAPFINHSELAHPDAKEDYQPDGDRTANGIEITSVSDEDKPMFVSNSIEGFKTGGRAVELLEVIAKSAALRRDTRLYFAKIGGKIAGGAGLTYLNTPFGQVAELYIDSTIPDSRGRGVETAFVEGTASGGKEASD
ncbi:hypothetical protein BDW69DRAFT_186830 [Aspergillus filifer]